MKASILVVAATLLPAAAFAQAELPEPARQQIYERCVPSCESGASNASCSQVCACAAEELGQRWDVAELRSYADKVRADPAGREAENLKRVAAQCARVAKR